MTLGETEVEGVGDKVTLGDREFESVNEGVLEGGIEGVTEWVMEKVW